MIEPLVAMKKKRAFLLTVLGILFIVLGSFSFITIFPVLISTKQSIPILIIWIIYGLFMIITGVGILFLKAWARILALVYVGIKMIRLIVGSIRDINTMVQKSVEPVVIFSGIWLTIVFLIIGCGIIYYLASSKVKDQFK